MTPPLPLPVRVAAGLVATAVEQARDLPRLALELPVSAVSHALQASMRVQQKVTELAIKGDRVLGVGPPIEDEPAWATFDDDPPPRRNGRATATVTPLRPAPDTIVAPDPAQPAAVAPDPAQPAAVAPDPAEADAVPPGPAASGPVDPEPAPSRSTTDAGGPNILPGYGSLTIPQLRGKLRYLAVDDLRALLIWEQAHGDRPPYVTMLSNRIAALTDK